MKIVITSHAIVVAEHDFDKPRLSLGRASTADIVLSYGTIAKHHCVFYRHGDYVMVCDTASTGGTRIDGRCVNREFMTPASRIEFGSIASLVVEGCKAPSSSDPIAELLATEPPDCMLFQLAILAPDRVVDVAQQAIEHGNLDIVPIDLATLAYEKHIPPLAMELAAHSRDADVRRRAAASPGVSLPTVTRLSEDPVPEVAQAALGHPSLDPYALGTLAKDPRDHVRAGVAANRMTPPDVCLQLARDRSADVRRALTNRSLRRDALAVLARDGVDDIRMRAAWLLATGTSTRWSSTTVSSRTHSEAGVAPEWLRLDATLRGVITIAGTPHSFTLTAPFEIRAYIGPTPTLHVGFSQGVLLVEGRAAPPKCHGWIDHRPDEVSLFAYIDGDNKGPYHGKVPLRLDDPCRLPLLTGPDGNATLTISDAGFIGDLVRTFVRGWRPTREP